MYETGKEPTEGSAASERVTLGCLTAYLIDQAREMGCTVYANALDKCLGNFLKDLPVEERAQTLMLCYEMDVQKLVPEPVRLRLVHSRD